MMCNPLGNLQDRRQCSYRKSKFPVAKSLNRSPGRALVDTPDMAFAPETSDCKDRVSNHAFVI
jgi:hypothetical protein